MKKLFLLLLLVGGLANAQDFTISGTIKDHNNGETLFGVSVFLEGTTNGVITNEYGFYSLTAPKGEYVLVVSYIGFTTLKQPLNLVSNQKVVLEMVSEVTSLEEVVLVAENDKKLDVKTPQMGVNKLTTSTIKKMPVVFGEVDVLKSIQLLPGVTNSGEGSGGFNVRGGAADQNLVLLDEAIIYNTSHLLGFVSVFNADAIKDVKLYKGSMPAQFGGRVSSVLDVRQKDGNSKRFALSGGIGLISARLTAEAPLFKNKGSFLIAGRGSYANLFLKATNNDNTVGFYDVNLKANYSLGDANRLFVSGYFGRDNFGSNAFDSSYGNFTGSLRWNHVFNPRLFSNLSAIYSKYDYQFDFDFLKMDWTANIKNYNLKYDFKYYTSDKLKMNFGLSGIYYDFNPGRVEPTSPESSINLLQLDRKYAFEGGAYISLEHKLSDKLTANYGLRYSNFTRLGDQDINTYANNLPVVYNNELEIYEAGVVTGKTSYDSGKKNY